MAEERKMSRSNIDMTNKITKWMLLLCTTVLLFNKTASTSEARVVCYYTNWSVYRPGTARFNPQNINPYLCTHLIYAFGGFTKDNTLKPFDKYQDIEKGGYAKFTGLKTYNKDLKTMLAIGGWNEGSSRFSPMVASKQRRKEFVKNSIKFLRQNRFDGLDLDWEYPAFRDGGKPKDRDNYARLVRELRDEFEREANKTGRARLLLTMAVPAGIEYIQKGYDVPKLNKYLDWFNILSYDYHSAFEPSVNHHSPLYPIEAPSEYSVDGELNIDYTIKFYLESGAEPDKLVLGIPTYGRSYTLFNADARELGAPADGPGEQGDATREKGYLAYYEICEYIKSPPKAAKKTKRADDDETDEGDESEEEEDPEDEPWTVVQPAPDAMGPYATRGNQWVGYDDIDIVRKKAEYVADKRLGGIMFWSIDNDDFRGTCHDKPYPLIEAAKEALIAKLGITDNSISSDKQTSTSVLNRGRSRENAAAKISSTERAISASRQNKKAVTATTSAWSVRTPEPPTTPDPGSDFKCEEEGFFDHPRDCKKYFWCLDSGPSNLGIVAHQFTCPSGLFFNTAAASCDFARNVFCKKEKATASSTTAPAPTTTTTTTRPTTDSATTRRSAAKLSSKSSLFFRSTTTTSTPASVKDGDAYEDEDGYDLTKGLLDTEEDPKVIKELISLIRKAGGVDQLEKQLNLGEDQSASTAAPTATIPKKLYERVLANTRSTTFNTKIDENAPGYNSRRGPQSAGLDKTPESNSIRKDRPKYTTINRTRSPTSTTETPQSEEEEDADESDEEEGETSAFVSKVSESYTQRPFTPQYVNIRRTKPTTTETTEDLAVNSATRNALLERNESILDTTINGAIQSNAETGTKRESLIPEYVSIRRGKPNNAAEESSNGATSKYQTIVRTRGTTTETPEPENGENSSPATLKSEKSNEVGEVTIQRTRGRTTVTPTTATSAQPLHDSDLTSSALTTESSPMTLDKAVTLSLGTPTTTVLNTPITTLLNYVASSDVEEADNPTSPTTAAASTTSTIQITEAPSPTSPTTTTTTTEAPASTTARKNLLNKRTRPTTTFSPTEATKTTTVKVSGEKKYAFIRRTRPAGVSTEATVEKLNFDEKSNDQNEILSKVEGNSLVKEMVGSNVFRSVVRKIRSTTPNSRELQEDDDSDSYGSRIADAARRRPVNRRRNDASGKIESNGENDYVARNDSAVTVSIDETFTPAPRTGTLKKFRNNQRKKIEETVDNPAIRESAAPNNNINARQPNRFRSPQPKGDSSSVDEISEPRFIPRSRSAQGSTRNTFKPRGTTERAVLVDDSVNSDSSVTAIVRPRPEFISRGRSRFTTEGTTPAKGPRENRKFNIARFTPRPFSRFFSSTVSELYDSNADGLTRHEGNVLADDGISDDGISDDGTEGLDKDISTSSSSSGVTRVIDTNIPIGQSNNTSFLRRTQSTSTTESQFTYEVDDKNEDIHLSASEHLEESEEQHEEEDRPTAPDEIPRKRVIVEKLRPITQNDAKPANVAIENEDSSNTQNELSATILENIQHDKTKQRRVKIIRRKPSAIVFTKTPVVEPGPSVTKNVQYDDIHNVTTNTNFQGTRNVSRIRKIVRKKIKPIATMAIAENTTFAHDILTTIDNNDDALKNSTHEELVIPTTEQSPAVTSTELSSSTSTTEEGSVSTSPPSPTTLRSRFERPLYRPTKRPINTSPSTETPSSSIRTFSRKFNIGAYTSPPTPNRDPPVNQTPTRSKLFGARPFSRKPVTTSRTTTKLDEDEGENNYSEEYEDDEEVAPANSFVFVPENKLFTRAPKNPILLEDKNKEKESEGEYDEVYDDENVEDQESSAKKPSDRPLFVPKPISNNSFKSTISPEAIYKTRPANNTRLFNRPSESKRAQNKPIGYAANKTSMNNTSSTETSLPKEVQEAIKEKHKLLFSEPKVYDIGQDKQKSSTDVEKSTEIESFEAIADSEDDEYLSTTDETEHGDDAYSSIFDSFTISETTRGYSTEQFTTIVTKNITLMPADDIESTEANFVESQTDDSVTLNDLTKNMDEIVTDKYDMTSQAPSTVSYHIFAVTDNDKSNGHIKETSGETLESNYTTLATTTESPITEIPVTEYEPIVKTQFDRLFSISRLVEISSKQDKHRLNKHNESRLIETGNVRQERKPKLDKIGEVNRFTLIKIVEGDIPIYLTKLGHVYPVDNPPNNYIRIDEARNAKSLKNFSDAGKENLIASESINEAYRHVNEIKEKSNTLSDGKENNKNNTTNKTSYLETVKLPETSKKTSDTYQPIPSEWNFYPAAYDDDKLKSKSHPIERYMDIITPRSYSTEPSTLALEGLFKTEFPSIQTARKVPENIVMGRVGAHQPFIVYAAPRSHNVNIKTRDEVLPIEVGSDEGNKSVVNLVKLEVLKPELGRSVKTYAKGQEFASILHEGLTIKYPISISVISSDGNTINTRKLGGQDSTRSENETTESFTATEANTGVNLTTVTIQIQTDSDLDSTTKISLASSSINPTIYNSITTTEPTDATADSTTETTTSRIQLVSGGLTNAANKRPKLNFPKRLLPGNSDITRISVNPLANSATTAKSSKTTTSPLNLSNAKLNKTGNFTSKSRFSSNRSQNVPVDNRRSQNQANSRTFRKQNSTEVVRIQAATSENTKIFNFKPIRPSFLRNSSQFRKSSTTPAPQTSTTGKRKNFFNRRTRPDSTTAESTSLDKGVTTESIRTPEESRTPAKNTFRRRGSSKFEPKEKLPQNSNKDERQPSDSPDSHRFGGNSRRPSLKPSISWERQNNTEALSKSTKSPNGRPTRTFVRPRRRFTKQSEGGAAGTTTPLSSSTTPATRITDARRKPFRVGVRRRNPTSSTPLPESTIDASSSKDLAGQESMEKAESDLESRTSVTTATETPTTRVTSASTKKEVIRKTVKIQRRPLTSVKTRQSQATTEETLTTSSSEEKKRDSKKYSASFKQNQLDEMLKNPASTEKIVPYASTESIEELSADTAIAIAAHQLLGAPLPSTAGYEYETKDDTSRRSPSPTTTSFPRSSPSTTPTLFTRSYPSSTPVPRAYPRAAPASLDKLEQDLHLTRDYLMESPVTGAFDSDFQYLTPLSSTSRTTQKSRKRVTQSFRRISTTIPPPTPPAFIITSPSVITARRRPDEVKAFHKIKPQGPAKTYRPIIDYEYYDDNDDKILDKFLGSSQNVLLDSRGVIECLDIGNFPHPSSCKKFISCAREGRVLYGWEYTCPSGLSYDPVGGICNWSAGLGCSES